MGQVIKLNSYLGDDSDRLPHSIRTLVPVEFAVGHSDRDSCVALLARYGFDTLHIRLIKNAPIVVVYLIPISDAIRLNKMILEKESLGEFEMGRRMDLIQMLENINPNLMDSIWESLSAGKS